MARKPMKVRVNEDTITISFNKEGWNPIHTKMLEAYVERFLDDGNIQGLKPAELMGQALSLESLNRNGHEAYTRWMRMLNRDVSTDEGFDISSP